MSFPGLDPTFPGQRSSSPARHLVTFNDGNIKPALDSHDERALHDARHSDPVVISDDPTLGQKVPFGISQASAVVVGSACAAIAVVCALALVTGVVHSWFARFLLVVGALVAVVPAVQTLPRRFWHRDGAIAIGNAGLTVHRRNDELHLAWVEIKGIKVDVTTHHRRFGRPPEVLSGRTKLQARSQILLAPAVPGGFMTHQASPLLKDVSTGGLVGPLLRALSPRADDALVSAAITYSHAIPLRHRLLVDDDHLPETVVLVDTALRRFAGKRRARPKVTRRQRPFLW